MSEQKIEVWITKYALTKGILHVKYAINCELPDGRCRGMISVQGLGYFHNRTFIKTWFLKEEQALEEARRLKDAKIESLKKQIAKLEKLTIKVRDL